MCEPTTIALVASAVISAGTAAYSMDQQGKAQKAVARNNQVMAEYAAQDAHKRGEQEAADLRRRAEALKGTQRNLMASRGLDLESGTAAELQDQTDYFSALDQGTARTNAANEAQSLRYQGALGMAVGEAQAEQARVGAYSTLLAAGSQVAGKWYTGTAG